MFLFILLMFNALMSCFRGE